MELNFPLFSPNPHRQYFLHHIQHHIYTNSSIPILLFPPYLIFFSFSPCRFSTHSLPTRFAAAKTPPQPPTCFQSSFPHSKSKISTPLDYNYIQHMVPCATTTCTGLQVVRSSIHLTSSYTATSRNASLGILLTSCQIIEAIILFIVKWDLEIDFFPDALPSATPVKSCRPSPQ